MSRSGRTAKGLDEIYNRYIAPLPKANLEERREKIHIEQFEWPLAAATLLLMIQFMIKDRASARDAVPTTTSAGRRSSHRRRARNSVGAASTNCLLVSHCSRRACRRCRHCGAGL